MIYVKSDVKLSSNNKEVLLCKYCRGKMKQRSLLFLDKVVAYIMNARKSTKRYSCTQCEKERFIMKK